MKIDCGETHSERVARLGEWHDFYAIFPRRVGSHDCRMFELIERKGRYFCDYYGSTWVWKYRAKNSVSTEEVK